MSTPERAKLLHCDHLTLGYEGRPVVTGVDFDVHAGDYLCIVGENGSGKTTLMKTILGLLPPLSGKVRTMGGLRQEEIGYMPQQTLAQRDFPASVREVVLSGCLNQSGLRPWYTKAQRQRAQRAMERLDIASIARACYRELSGGQQQRALLARSLCAAGKLLLLDEPAAGLDPHITEALYSLIQGLNRDGLTILMITHDMRAASSYASHILHVAASPLYWGSAQGYLSSEVGRLYALRELNGERAH